MICFSQNTLRLLVTVYIWASLFHIIHSYIFVCAISAIVLDFQSSHNDDKAADEFRSQLYDFIIKATELKFPMKCRKGFSGGKEIFKQTVKFDNGGELPKIAEQTTASAEDAELRAELLRKISQLTTDDAKWILKISKPTTDNAEYLQEIAKQTTDSAEWLEKISQQTMDNAEWLLKISRETIYNAEWLIAALGPSAKVTCISDIGRYFENQSYIIEEFEHNKSRILFDRAPDNGKPRTLFLNRIICTQYRYVVHCYSYHT